jgi:catechol 2,3-dioxygenase-like lactoylglutathione lyase family enzyme
MDDVEVRDELAFQHASVAQVRIARPTVRLPDVLAFYRDGLGLRELDRFEDHHGYDGVILGLPGRTYQLEFTQHRRGGPCPPPTGDNLLVLYVPRAEQILAICERLERRGHRPVAPENPYWLHRSVTYEDPDRWRVVLCNGDGL